MTYTTTLTSKGQITLPAEIRKQLNLKRGSKVVFEAKGNTFFVYSKQPIVDKLAGSFKLTKYQQELSVDEAIKKAKQVRFSKNA